MAECRKCGAPIVWANTPQGGRMPVDRDPVLGGKIDLAKSSGNGIPTAYGLNDGERFNAVLDGKDLYRSHHESCPEIIANSRGRRKQGRRRKR